MAVNDNFTVLALGNPLLDMIANTPLELLDKYGLKLNDAILAGEQHKPLYGEIEDNFTVSYIPGGSAQNTIRVCQALIRKPFSCGYVGCIGVDSRGDLLKKLLKEEGLVGLYADSDSAPTGTCAVLVNGDERSLCTTLGAAGDYTIEHLESCAWPYVEKAKILYATGYFLTSCCQAAVLIGQHCALNNKLFCFNLSAAFLMKLFKKEVMEVLPYTDVLFGNAEEFLNFAECEEYDSKSLEEIAGRVAQLPKENTERRRIVVVTQGSEETIVASIGADNGVKIQKFPVEPVGKSKLVDTNGAGDAFVGGYLYCMAEGKDLESAIRCGTYAARNVIQRSGCTFYFEDMPTD